MDVKKKYFFLKIEASFQKTIDVLMNRKTTQSNDAVVLRKRGCCGGKRGATEGLLGLRKVFLSMIVKIAIQN